MITLDGEFSIDKTSAEVKGKIGVVRDGDPLSERLYLVLRDIAERTCLMPVLALDNTFVSGEGRATLGHALRWKEPQP